MSTIRRNVPMPASVRSSTGAVAQLRELDADGASFHVPSAEVNFKTDAGNVDLPHGAKAMQSTLFYPSQKLGFAVRVRPVDSNDPDGEGLRVWRVTAREK